MDAERVMGSAALDVGAAAGLTAEEFVVALREAMQASGEPASVVAPRCMDTHGALLSVAALHELATDGAAYRACNLDARARRVAMRLVRTDGGAEGCAATEKARGAAPSAPRVGVPLKEKVLSVLADITLYTVNGERKTLLAFTLEDWVGLRDDHAARAVSEQKRADLAAKAVALLEQHGVERTDALPQAAKRALAVAAGEVWG